MDYGVCSESDPDSTFYLGSALDPHLLNILDPIFSKSEYRRLPVGTLEVSGLDPVPALLHFVLARLNIREAYCRILLFRQELDPVMWIRIHLCPRIRIPNPNPTLKRLKMCLK